jgi:hypothetical protein
MGNLPYIVKLHTVALFRWQIPSFTAVFYPYSVPVFLTHSPEASAPATIVEFSKPSRLRLAGEVAKARRSPTSVAYFAARLTTRSLPIQSHQSNVGNSCNSYLLSAIRSYSTRRHDQQQPQERGPMSSLHRGEDNFPQPCSHRACARGPSRCRMGRQANAEGPQMTPVTLVIAYHDSAAQQSS